MGKCNDSSSSEKETPSLNILDILDPQAIQDLFDQFYKLTNIGSALLDMEGNVLVATGWQDICTKFHRAHSKTSKFCVESDIELSTGIKKGEFKLYKCKNNMWDMATPIIIENMHIGNLYLGQFFFDDDVLDLDQYREQCRQYSFDEKEYMTALKKVPRWGREKVNAAMGFYTKLAGIICDMGTKNMHLKNLLQEREALISSVSASESMLRRYIENAPEGIFITDRYGMFKEVNKATYEITGYTASELIGRNILIFVPKTEHQVVREHIKKLSEKGKTYLEIPFIHKDGSIRYWSVDGIIIAKDCIAGFTKDITERKLSEKRLERLADDYEKVFNSLQDVMFLVKISSRKGRLNYRFARVNNAFIKRANVNMEGIIGKTPYEIFDRPYADTLFEHFTACMAHRDSFTFEEEISGHIWLTTINPIKGNSDTVRYLIGSSSDITVKKQAELLLKKQLSFQKILADISAGFVNATPENVNGIIDSMLCSLCQFFVVDKGYIYEFYDNGSKMSKTYEWSADGNSKTNIKRSIEQYSWWANEIKHKSYIYIKDINKLPAEAKFEKKVFMEQGIKSLINILIKKEDKVLGFLGFDSLKTQKEWDHDQISFLTVTANIVFDALSRNRIELELIKSKENAIAANKIKSDFIANVSHEIRTPLNGIIGFTDLLMSTELNKNQRTFLENVNISARSLLDILNDILDFSKLEAGKMALNEEFCDIFELIENAADIVKYGADRKDLELLLNILPDTPRYVLLDGLRVKQVLINLLNNAIKFTNKGEVELKIYPQFSEYEDRVKLFFSIRDTGIGISDQDKQKIFDDFSQLDPSTTRKYGGSGLGLTITNKLLQNMGTTVNLSSKVNHGSVFSFCLNRPYKKEHISFYDYSQRIKRVLIIDDNTANIAILQNMFKCLGILYEGYSNIDKAIERSAQTGAFQVIIIDLNMPEMNGIEVSRKICRAKDTTIVIMHSFREEKESDDIFSQLGFHYRLTKPVKFRELISLLDNISNKDENHKQMQERKHGISFKKFPEEGPHTVLVAEDNSINFMLVYSIIKEVLPQSIIIEAKDGNEAVNMFREANPDIIFMDIQMPNKDGLTACFEIRELEQDNMHVPIIALTARSVYGEKEKCTEAGMNDYILKPIRVDTMVQILEKYLINKEKRNPHFNRKGLLKILYGNTKLFDRMISESKKAIPQYIDELEKAFEAQDITLIREKAHKLKGAALTMNFYIMSGMAKKIETDLGLDLKQISQIIQELKKELIIILKELDKN